MPPRQIVNSKLYCLVTDVVEDTFAVLDSALGDAVTTGLLCVK